MTMNGIQVRPANRGKILLVDDEKMIREYLETILHDAGYTTMQVANGSEALGVAGVFEPDVILLDYMMPEMNGLDVLKFIKSHHMNIPCIIITGKGSEELAVTMLKEGAFDYLTKPFHGDDLLEVVNKAILLGKVNPETYHFSRQELVFLRQENQFLKDQLRFMRKMLTMDREGDAVLDGLSQKLLEIELEDEPRERTLDRELKIHERSSRAGDVDTGPDDEQQPA